MDRKTFSNVQIYVRDNYNRAGKLFSGGDVSGAIRVLVSVIRSNPELPVLYERIREYELAKFRMQNPLVKPVALLLSIPVVILVRLLIFIRPVRAMILCEGPLAFCVDNPLMLNTIAAAADACGAPWAAATALNVIKTLHPGNTSNLRRLVTALQQNGQARDALKIQQQLAKAAPGDLEEQNRLREAMALASIERGRWNEKGDAQQKSADSGSDAVMLQLLEGTIHDAEQAQLVIDRFTKELQENDSIDMRRKLADAYMVAGQYDKAMTEYEKVAAKLGVADPVLDKQIEKAYIAQIDQSLELLRGNPESYENAEGQIADLTKEREGYRMRHALKRAETFPNDMQLQFDLSELYFEHGDVAKSKEILEQIVENPQKRRPGLVLLGRCELAQKDPASARTHIEAAVKEMYSMDRMKREALYYLGVACEESGDVPAALGNYREIQENMVGYRDVDERIEKLSGAKA